MFLYIIRHGEPIYSNDTLTELGSKQADALADRLEESGINRIFSSPNGRARLTAEPTAKRLGLPINIEPWATEDLAYKAMHKTFPDGKVRWAQDASAISLRNNETVGIREGWENLPPFADVPTMKEGYDRIARESDGFLERLGYKREGTLYKIVEPTDDKVAIFCHSGMGCSWISHLLDIPPHIFWADFLLTHSGVSIFAFWGKKDEYTVPRCLAHSDMSHMFGAGIPLKFNGSFQI